MKIVALLREKNTSEKNGKKKKGMRRCLINQTGSLGRVDGQFFSSLSLTISSHHRCRPSAKKERSNW